MNELISLFPTLVLASLASIGRVWLTILASIISGWFLAWASIKSKVFENTYISLSEVFESVPVFSFLPIVFIFFVYDIGGSLGIELAVLFLVFTATVWNIWMGIYQAFKTVPHDLVEVSENYKFGFWGKMLKLYVPYSIPRISSELMSSFSDGLFYITVSEVFSVGTKNFEVFGIGSVIANLTQEGNYLGALEGLAILGVFVAIITYLLREFAKYSVSKYGLDTEMRVSKKGRLNIRGSLRLTNSLPTFTKIARVFPTVDKLRRYSYEDYYEEPHKRDRLWKIIGVSVGILLLGLIIYGAIGIILSVSVTEWHHLIASIPEDLIAIGVDYIRVGIITGVSFLLAVFLGYYLATHEKVEKVAIPVIQAFAAFPAPAYFPLLFLATIGIFRAIFGPFTNEFYVLLIGFISTFYYVFYSFWLGVKNMPTQYWEIMKNYQLSFLDKMRKIIIPATLPYIVTGLSSTINSAWGGLAIAEYWPDIVNGYNLYVRTGMMKDIVYYTNVGDIADAAWLSFLFGIIVVIYSILFTRKLMDLSRQKYIAEEGIYLA
ncbi:ABC transporter permease subunit [Stygiolobus caldivivus]|uniref:Sugar ABC transporter permease n=1 Tax=Stygiolobus caldivivus TaxID=2824673 RepID=A0A8D5ZJB6_9CREN|nr:ABC transporter permease subunit [Stygiolobus caldivivus]BCU70441.1 sugar ABC transporter permease [Stygiolobus caldivivus]